MQVGDHGWQLGEMNEWRKMSNFELAVRVPLLIFVPWRPASHGVRSARIVEAVSLYQTIAELAGLPPPAGRLQGASFAAAFGAETAVGGAGPVAAAAATGGEGEEGGRR